MPSRSSVRTVGAGHTEDSYWSHEHCWSGVGRQEDYPVVRAICRQHHGINKSWIFLPGIDLLLN